MPIRLYNTLDRKIEEFTPQDPHRVRIYACGVTVYDEAHIGHASQAVFFDIVRSYLQFRGYEVEYVRNFTDIDDKIINKARETGQSAAQVSEHYIEETRKDLAALKVRPADVEPKVTDHIDDIIGFIEELCAKGCAYEAAGNVLFSLESYEQYGKLSNRRVDEAYEGEPLEGKKHPADFALWKASKPGEPSWPSPWGPGRPGWHIECSALARRYLGDTLDIHGGGVDLVFPHHENEIAQSESRSGKPLARYWVHNGLVMVNGQKMSKSLGNFYTIKQALAEHVPDVIRYVILSHHYSSNIDFSHDSFRNAEKRIYYFYRTLAAVTAFLAEHDHATPNEERRTGDLLEQFAAAMDDNLNTAKALAAVSNVFTEANALLENRKMPKGEKADALRRFLGNLRPVADVLQILNEEPAGVLEAMKTRFLERRGIEREMIEARIAQRRGAKQRKDYATADAIRAQLGALGIKLLDLADRTEWEIAPE
ncbi:MAG: cysteine--tRNA ligase [Chitinivibrionales bacterium]|nr:cysteine--tRNA ligase [Chitinivibrionales bacterium]